MKKITTLLFVLGLAVNLNAQQTIEFKIEYKENTTYIQTSKANTQVETVYKGDKDMLDMLAAQGIENPTINKNLITTISKTKAGKLKGTEIPLVIELSMDSGENMPNVLPTGTAIYGRMNKNAAPVYDSIHAPGMDAAMKEMFFTTMKNIASQVYVPARKVKVGEAFTVDTPLKIPAGPIELVLKNIITYKLVKVEGKKAYFDVKYAITMDSEVEGTTMKATGDGAGTIVYDIENSFIVNNDGTIDMNMDMDVMGMMLTIKSKVQTVQNTVIAK